MAILMDFEAFTMIPMWGSIHPAQDGGVGGGRRWGNLGLNWRKKKSNREREREREGGNKKETRREKKRKKKKKKGLGVRNPRMMMLMKQNLPPSPSQQVA
jgi:hypothetical protein